MAKVNIQNAVAEYHQMMTNMGMDMHNFHANWHMQHPDPHHPDVPDVNWGVNIPFGSAFLQMHHEMVKAADDEPRQFMHHQSIVYWFHDKQYDLPTEWNPLTPISPELAFIPANPLYKRINENPKFQLPNYFTVQGITAGEEPEPITGAKRLADFQNINQLGCCIIYPHNEWHIAIGGAMSYSFFTAIDDPIFYFGVHWHIDKVFDAYKTIPQFYKSNKRNVPKRFTSEQLNKLKTAAELGIRIC